MSKSGISATIDNEILEKAKRIAYKRHIKLSHFIEEAMRETINNEESDKLPYYIREHARRLANSQNEVEKHKAMVDDELEFFKRHDKYKEIIKKE